MLLVSNTVRLTCRYYHVIKHHHRILRHGMRCSIHTKPSRSPVLPSNDDQRRNTETAAQPDRGATSTQETSLDLIDHQQPDHMQVFKRIRLPHYADVVICGGGIVGCAVAYCLAQSRLRRVVLLEKHPSILDSGTTSSASKFFTLAQPTRDKVLWAMSSLRLYSEVDDNVNLFSLNYGFPTQQQQQKQQQQKEEEDNQPEDSAGRGITRVTPVGSITLASSPNRAIENLRKQSLLGYRKIECEILSPSDVERMFPDIYCNDLQNALWVKDDLMFDVRSVRKSLYTSALSLGVNFVSDCKVKEVVVGPSQIGRLKVVGVSTEHGFINTPVFVNCGGPFAHEIGLSNGNPLNACIGPCLMSSLTAEAVDKDIAVPGTLIDPDNGFWMVREGKQVTISGTNLGKAINTESMKDKDSMKKPMWDDIEPCLSSAMNRVPALNSFKVNGVRSDIDSFSYDYNFTAGEIANVVGCYVVAGMNGEGAIYAGAAAKMLQSQLDRMRSRFNLNNVSPSRSAFTDNNRLFRESRTSEISVSRFQITMPSSDFEFHRTCRGLRVSPLFDRLRSSGAVFGSQCGYEWPLFFDTENAGSVIPAERLLFGNCYRQPHYADIVKNEYTACRKGVGISDVSGYVKILVESSDSKNSSLSFLKRVCCTFVDNPVNNLSRALMLNRMGTYVNDIMIGRIAIDKFLLIAPCLQTNFCYNWLTQHVQEDENVRISDVTGNFAIINLIGPSAVRLLQSQQTNVNLAMTDFPPSTMKRLVIGPVGDLLTLRLTFTGLDGFTLFVPNNSAPILYEYLLRVGKPFGIMNVGYYALRTFRVEHGITNWGNEASQAMNPIECNKGGLVKMTRNFIGKEALLQSIYSGIFQRVFQFVVDEHEIDNVWPAEGDPIYDGDLIRGYVTSNSYSFELNRPVILAVIRYHRSGMVHDEIAHRQKFELDIAGSKYPLQLITKPLHFHQHLNNRLSE